MAGIKKEGVSTAFDGNNIPARDMSHTFSVMRSRETVLKVYAALQALGLQARLPGRMTNPSASAVARRPSASALSAARPLQAGLRMAPSFAAMARQGNPALRFS